MALVYKDTYFMSTESCQSDTGRWITVTQSYLDDKRTSNSQALGILLESVKSGFWATCYQKRK